MKLQPYRYLLSLLLLVLALDTLRGGLTSQRQPDLLEAAKLGMRQLGWLP